ncbi:hypothetical protein [Gorillibacterium sp. sgz5001074]|uniref:hypothetical protein n=1 Tax=Gorillibacterium sp. sgz5001074 TaxID=3446695 RepID=UPI003F66482C
MKRYQFRAQCRPGIEPETFVREASLGLQDRMSEAGVRHLCLFGWNSQLFLYYESLSEETAPHSLLSSSESMLELWPGADMPRSWVPMLDIFHYQVPAGVAHWQRTNPAAKPYARIARLKPEQAASYIFYHYQYQEERPGDGDKYGIIALHENLMFFYSETPATIEPPPYRGKLTTSNTPADWMGVMMPHFLLWEGETVSNPVWMELPLLLQA